MTGEQLQTKQVIIDGLTIVGTTVSIGFQLPRGKVARVWGFSWNMTEVEPSTNAEYQCFVRKTENSSRQIAPKDILWSALTSRFHLGGSWAFIISEKHIMFPKPHRTVGLTGQFHASVDTDTRGVLVIYYDIANMIAGEATQKLEKSVLRARTRRSREFD